MICPVSYALPAVTRRSLSASYKKTSTCPPPASTCPRSCQKLNAGWCKKRLNNVMATRCRPPRCWAFRATSCAIVCVSRAGTSPAPTLYGMSRPLRSRVGAGHPPLAPALASGIFLHLGPVEHDGLRGVAGVYLNAAFWYDDEGVGVEQGGHDVGALVAGCAGYETAVAPGDMGADVVASHRYIAHPVFDDDLDLRAQQARVSQHFADHGSAKQFEGHSC